MSMTDVTARRATLARDGVFTPPRHDVTFDPAGALTGDSVASRYRRYGATLALIAGAIAADAVRHPAIGNTLAMIERAVRDAAGDCDGIADGRSA